MCPIFQFMLIKEIVPIWITAEMIKGDNISYFNPQIIDGDGKPYAK